ncbi:11-S seed storage protein, conserved site-containing protein [Artemisia annua]|uniref:11-S seed storage protein, conserved site-containing protein n=1 Tax=Artemisia annua TaxID=35608 RepID=A0A2U1L7J6_ARTAN|nr:11-S seed storage protein, conserved site-containing protein [Artemisia annua]
MFAEKHHRHRYHALSRSPRLGGGRRLCNLQRLAATKPALRFDFEGGSIETWDVNDDQLKYVGVAPSKITIQPNSLTLPNYHPFPRLIFIEEGEGMIGVDFPGCPETFDTGLQQQEQQETRDSHQKVHRFVRGDIIAIPADTVTGCTTTRTNKLLLLFSMTLTTRPTNSTCNLSFNFDNIFAGFNTELLAEAFNIEPRIVRLMQESSENGIIIKVKEPMQIVTPEEEKQQQPRKQGRGGSSNGFEEKMCSATILHNLDSQSEADIFSRQAGKLNTVNENKLPILSYLDLSAEKGYLQQNALISPHWSINSHTMLYILSGEAQVQVVSNDGQAVMDEQVKQGDIFVVPQFFATTARAGQNGFEWVAFKTNKSPMKSPVAGYTSVFRAMPIKVITNAYDVSPSQAQNLKTNRETESILLSPQRISYQLS